MAEVDEFLDSVLPTLDEMEMAFHNGDAGPRVATWSHDDPVTLFGAKLMKSGWSEVAPAFEFLATRFSNGSAYEYEVIGAGASGDLAYIVGYEHTMASVGGAAPSGTPVAASEGRATRRPSVSAGHCSRHAVSGLSDPGNSSLTRLNCSGRPLGRRCAALHLRQTARPTNSSAPTACRWQIPKAVALRP